VQKGKLGGGAVEVVREHDRDGVEGPRVRRQRRLQ
jgi:hypothetical protein